MQLRHIEHPEDTILTGDLSAINWFTLQGKVSLKIDGCPAIVWGTNLTSTILDMVILKNAVRVLPLGL